MSTIDDRGDFKSVMGALKSSGFSPKHIDTLWNIVGAVLHLVRRSLDCLNESVSCCFGAGIAQSVVC